MGSIFEFWRQRWGIHLKGFKMDQLPTKGEFVERLRATTKCGAACEFLDELISGTEYQGQKNQQITKEIVMDIAFGVSRRFIGNMYDFGEGYSNKKIKELDRKNADFFKSLFSRATEMGFEIDEGIIREPLDLGAWTRAREVKLSR